jgi:hypothetical protein
LSYIIIGSTTLVAVVLLAQLLRRDPTALGQISYGENIGGEQGLKFTSKTLSLKGVVSTRQFWLFSSMMS